MSKSFEGFLRWGRYVGSVNRSTDFGVEDGTAKEGAESNEGGVLRLTTLRNRVDSVIKCFKECDVIAPLKVSKWKRRATQKKKKEKKKAPL